ncbi:MAG: hypothetical protein KAI08_16880, partial [Bacteroidales bacterium]|nr:hypothetical protein [Bacteroidales bacterium]
MRTVLFLSTLIVFVVLLFSSSGFAGESSDQSQNVTPELRDRCVEMLREALAYEECWDKVQSAEYLLALDYAQGVRETFEVERVAFENNPGCRIGIWLVLAKATHNHNAREVWIEKIRGAFYDLKGLDSDYAAEALSKLNFQIPEEDQERYQTELQKFRERKSINNKARVSARLAESGSDSDLPHLITMLENPDFTVRVEAANAILHIERRVPSHMNWLDWLVIGIYGIGMIVVGFYYMRRTKSSDDYLLGGRTMKPWAVGLSLFATLLSTISYLATPGEIIQNGPMLLGQVAAMPFIFWIIGWFFIPFIMRLKVTSAYEILEKRLGVSIRILGAATFLSLRLLWMAVIIYATTDTVLIPLTGLDPAMTPWVCGVLGIVTLIYTSMGGLRAVVMTDVVQTFILFGGAILVIILISVHFGGISEWWPHGWAENWPPPRWGFQTSGQRTFGWFFMASVIWYVCTSASDQMSIQRFLATRDVKAARRVLGVSLIANTAVLIFLSLLGYALLAYFQANPHILKDGQTIIANADQLLPQYIVLALPAGISGLIVAGLLAAAMSSLSSGVNSSSLVITVDFIDRFRKIKLTEVAHIKMARYATVVVGVIVVGISFYVSAVPGNLLEVTFRAVNLLVSPLFILFCMAMFIPWATEFGTWVGTLCSIGIAVVIAFWENIFGGLGPSFLFIMPASLVVGVVVGMTASLLPIGRGPRSMLSKVDDK